MKRLGYRKSRTGCLRCKERRVKCDEKRPCSACVRHEVPCSLSTSADTAQKAEQSFIRPSAKRTKRSVKRAYSSLGSTGSAKRPSASAEHCSEFSLSPVEENEDETHHDHNETFALFAALFSNLRLGEKANWVSDMELMHHYTSITYATLSNGRDVQNVLQQDLPRIGFQHKFLLHRLLAFSGYHLAYLNQDKRHAFFSQASEHQNCAIEGLRIVLASAHVSEHCHALYAASIILIICSFATYPSYDRFDGTSDPVDNIIGVFSLIKGMNMMRLESGGEISTGPLATFFGRMQCGGSQDKDSGLRIIRAHVEQLITTLGQTTLGSDGIEHAIASLSNSIETSISRPSPTSTASLRASFLWPILIGTDYIAALRQRRPTALVVLAFYCTVLQAAEGSCWALEGWAESLEGSQWETFIEWPNKLCWILIRMWL